MSGCDTSGLLPLQQAKEMLRRSVDVVVSNERVDVLASLDCVLAEDCLSQYDVPNFDNSAMDGYALIAGDAVHTSSSLKMIGKSFAGKPFDGAVHAGECVRIMTGAKIPDGADCVVMQENTTVEGVSVTIIKPVNKGENIRLAGNDITKGECVISAGKRIGPIDIGVLVSLGLSSVLVRKKLRVAVFSTGDELLPLGAPPVDGKLYDSNRPFLIAMLQKLNVEVRDFGCIPDDEAKIEDTFHKAANECDAIITSGGVSVGEADFTGDVLHRIGDVTFYKVAVKPGKPFAFGTINDAVFFGLPGNPVSTALTFHQLVLPTLRHMAGEVTDEVLLLRATAVTDLKKRPGRTDFQRGVLSVGEDGELLVEAIKSQSSGAFTSMLHANCFIRLEQEQGAVVKGEIVRVVPFDKWLQ